MVLRPSQGRERKLRQSLLWRKYSDFHPKFSQLGPFRLPARGAFKVPYGSVDAMSPDHD